MSSFDEYADYYDLVYRGKNYAAEADFVANLLLEQIDEGGSVVDLGCGTAAHAACLAARGFRVLGVDRSARMLALAESRLLEQPTEIRNRVSLERSDISDLRLNRQFDAATALFHVMSYLTEDQALDDAFAGIRCHLNPGGPFIFDFWYGPAVVAQEPVQRTTLFESEDRVVKRTVIPRHLRERRIVEVAIELEVRIKTTDERRLVREVHPMRYFYPSEIEPRLSQMGFSLVRCGDWMTNDEPSEQSWSAYVVAVAT